MCVSCTGWAAAFFSASDPSLSQEVADGKINVQSACALNTVCITASKCGCVESHFKSIRTNFTLQNGIVALHSPLFFFLRVASSRLPLPNPHFVAGLGKIRPAKEFISASGSGCCCYISLLH
jgi:hypothetical protein